jgi:phosphoglucosamine mutase
MARYFGTDGIRGRVGQFPIQPDFVVKLGWAAGQVLKAVTPRPLVLIGKDTRISGYMLESALEAGFVSAGVDVRLLGPMPTPAIAYLTQAFGAQAGVVISASHNPFEDNGIKFFSASGHKLSSDMELAIEQALEQPMVFVDSAQLGKVKRIEDATGRYIEFCKSTLARDEQGRPLRLSGLKIVVDCANGAAYKVAPRVLQELGAEVTVICDQPDGLNINLHCGATDLEALKQAVRDEKADLGLALDGDGDRLMMVDSTGQGIDGDGITWILARHGLQTGRIKRAVVGTLMTNLGLEHGLNRMGLQLLRTQVGDKYVMQALREEQLVLGAEPSGHVICMDRIQTGDGLVAALQVLEVMISTGQSIEQLMQGFEVFPQVNRKFATQHKHLAEAASVQQTKQELEQSLGADGRIIVRASGTEPIIRVTVEGKCLQVIEKVAEQLLLSLATAQQKLESAESTTMPL